MTTESPQSTETAILLTCAQCRWPSEAEGPLRALVQAGVDWSALIATARRHGVVALLYRTLASSCSDLVPSGALAELKTWQRANSLRNMMMVRELVRIVRALAAQGVRALPYKGVVLGGMAYGDLSLRSSVDTDILLPERDVDAARRVVAALDYNLTADCRAQEEAYRRVHHHLTLSRGDNQTLLELHWRLAARQFCLHLDFDQLWHRSRDFLLLDQPVRSPSVEDMLLMVCIHAAMHGWKQVKLVSDVAWFVHRHADMNWPGLLGVASSAGALRMLLLGLALSRDLLAAELPDGVSAAACADPVVPGLVADLRQVILDPATSPGEPDQRDYAYYARLRERRRDRLEETARRFFIPSAEEWSATSVPSPLSILHYVIRPLRLARRLFWRRPSPSGSQPPSPRQNKLPDS